MVNNSGCLKSNPSPFSSGGHIFDYNNNYVIVLAQIAALPRGLKFGEYYYRKSCSFQQNTLENYQLDGTTLLNEVLWN